MKLPPIKFEDIFLVVMFVCILIFGLAGSCNGQDPLYQHQLYKFVNNDGTVYPNGTGMSLALLLEHYDSISTGDDIQSVVDLDGDGVVNVGDLMQFLGSYGDVLWNVAQFNCGASVGTFACWFQYYPEQVLVIYHYPDEPFKMVQTDEGEWWWFTNNP